MKKLSLNVWHYIGLLFIILHLLYTIYMFTQSVMYGALWMTISLIEIVIFLLGYKKFSFLNIFLVIVLVLQCAFSCGIMLMGSDKDVDNADYVLVLGYQLDHDQMTQTLEMRLDKAYEYSKQNPDSILVLCGGITRENTISEAEVMSDYLIQKGIDENKLVLEDKSTDTIENIQNSLDYIDEDSSILVISSNYHVFRAKLIAQKAGINAKGSGSSAPFLLIPNQLLFEKLGMIKILL